MSREQLLNEPTEMNWPSTTIFLHHRPISHTQTDTHISLWAQLSFAFFIFGSQMRPRKFASPAISAAISQLALLIPRSCSNIFGWNKTKKKHGGRPRGRRWPFGRRAQPLSRSLPGRQMSAPPRWPEPCTISETNLVHHSSFIVCAIVCVHVCVYRYRWVRCNRDHRDRLCWWKRKPGNSVCSTSAHKHHSKVYRIPVQIKRFAFKPFHL